MLTAVVLCVLAQVHSTVSLDPVPSCATCDALMVRVAALEARLAAVPQEEPPRRVRLIEVSRPARVLTRTVEPIRYPQVFTSWAPGYTALPMPRVFGPRFFSGSACGPNGCR